MDLSVFKSISIPPPELTSAASLKMAKEGDHPSDQAVGEGKLMLEFPPQAYTKSPQQRARGRPSKQQQAFPPSFHPPPGLAPPPVPQACPQGLQQPLQQPALPPPVAQQPASTPVALPQQVAQPTSMPQPSAEQASQPKPVRGRITQKGPGPAASKLHSILEKARTIQEIELAVNASEEELRDSQEVLKNGHLQAYYEDDLSLYPEDEIKKATLKEGENLQGTYGPVPKSSFTPQQLKQAIQTRGVVQPRPSQEGEASLKARFVAKGFKQQILDPSLETYASTPSHLSLRVLLISSLVNRWDVVTADVSSAFLQAPIPSEKLVLVKPPPELEQNPDVLWRLKQALYGLKTSPKLWQQHLASKLEEADPCIFMGEKLLVMTYVDDLLIVGEQQEQESFITKLSAHFPLKHKTRLDAKTPLTFCTRPWSTKHQSTASTCTFQHLTT